MFHTLNFLSNASANCHLVVQSQQGSTKRQDSAFVES